MLYRRDEGCAKLEHRREDVGEFRPHVLAERRKGAGIEPPQVLVERVDEDRSRQIRFELRCRAREDEPTPPVRPSAELCEEPGLPDPRLTPDLDRRRVTKFEQVEHPLDQSELLDATHEVVCDRSHVAPFREHTRRWEGSEGMRWGGDAIRIPVQIRFAHIETRSGEPASARARQAPTRPVSPSRPALEKLPGFSAIPQVTPVRSLSPDGG